MSTWLQRKSVNTRFDFRSPQIAVVTPELALNDEFTECVSHLGLDTRVRLGKCHQQVVLAQKPLSKNNKTSSNFQLKHQCVIVDDVV